MSGGFTANDIQMAMIYSDMRALAEMCTDVGTVRSEEYADLSNDLKAYLCSGGELQPGTNDPPKGEKTPSLPGCESPCGLLTSNVGQSWYRSMGVLKDKDGAIQFCGNPSSDCPLGTFCDRERSMCIFDSNMLVEGQDLFVSNAVVRSKVACDAFRKRTWPFRSDVNNNKPGDTCDMRGEKDRPDGMYVRWIYGAGACDTFKSCRKDSDCAAPGESRDEQTNFCYGRTFGNTGKVTSPGMCKASAVGVSCPYQRKCRFDGRCPCNTDSDCPGTSTCRDGACVVDRPVCRVDAECEDKDLGKCAKRTCRNDDDCLYSGGKCEGITKDLPSFLGGIKVGRCSTGKCSTFQQGQCVYGDYFTENFCKRPDCSCPTDSKHNFQPCDKLKLPNPEDRDGKVYGPLAYDEATTTCSISPAWCIGGEYSQYPGYRFKTFSTDSNFQSIGSEDTILDGFKLTNGNLLACPSDINYEKWKNNPSNTPDPSYLIERDHALLKPGYMCTPPPKGFKGTTGGVFSQESDEIVVGPDSQCYGGNTVEMLSLIVGSTGAAWITSIDEGNAICKQRNDPD